MCLDASTYKLDENRTSATAIVTSPAHGHRRAPA
jgi:hypothetical protein